MIRNFYILSLLIVVLTGCTSRENPVHVSPTTNVSENTQPTQITPCDHQANTNEKLIRPVFENNKVAQLQLSDSFATRIDFGAGNERIFITTNKGIYIVNITDGEVLCIIPDEDLSFSGMALSQDGALFASVNRHGKITLRNSVTGVMIHELQNGLFETEGAWNWAEFNRDGSLLVSSGYSQPVRVWDIANDQIVLETLGVHAAISPNGELLAVSGVNYMQIVAIASKTAYITRADSSTNPHIMDLQFSRDGSLLYALNTYSEINVWDVETGELVRTLNSCPDCTGWGWEVEYLRMSLSKDGEQLLLVVPSAVILWDTQTWTEIMVESSPRNDSIRDASISSDGEKIAIIRQSTGNMIHLLDVDQ